MNLFYFHRIILRVLDITNTSTTTTHHQHNNKPYSNRVTYSNISSYVCKNTTSSVMISSSFFKSSFIIRIVFLALPSSSRLFSHYTINQCCYCFCDAWLTNNYKHRQPLIYNRKLYQIIRHQHWYTSTTITNMNEFNEESNKDILDETFERDDDTTIKEEQQRQCNDDNQIIRKVHTVTVCMVPPPPTTATPDNQRVWNKISEMRRQLKDPGYYRWPPHVNLLYPFLKLDGNVDQQHDNNGNSISDVVKQIETAIQDIPPFLIELHHFGTFGGKNRGVLWLRPNSKIIDDDDDDTIQEDTQHETSTIPLHHLQASLEKAFPMCRDQSQKGDKGVFVPHMTISHFECLDDALTAQKELESSFPNRDDYLNFVLDRIYLLERKGDNGQFLRVADIAVGTQVVPPSSVEEVTKIYDPPIPFPDMPTKEDDWVYEERMKMKERRRKNNGGGRGRRGGGNRRRRSNNNGPRIPDTPEVIAAKRAERKAKKERLLLQEQQRNEEE